MRTETAFPPSIRQSSVLCSTFAVGAFMTLPSCFDDRCGSGMYIANSWIGHPREEDATHGCSLLQAAAVRTLVQLSCKPSDIASRLPHLLVQQIGHSKLNSVMQPALEPRHFVCWRRERRETSTKTDLWGSLKPPSPRHVPENLLDIRFRTVDDVSIGHDLLCLPREFVLI